MALETSPQAPAPVRQIANAITGWVDRLGAVWVEGQVAQVSRRPGVGTVFLHAPRLGGRHLDPGHLPARPLRLAQPAPGRGRQRGPARQALVLRQPRHPVARRPRDPPRRPRRAARPARAPPPAARGRGPVRPRAQAQPALPARRVGLVTAPDSAAERDVVENARRRWPAVAFETAYAAMQGTRAAAEVIAAIDRLDRDERVDVIVVARGGGAVEDLLPFSDEGLIRAVAKCRTPSCRRSATSPTSRCSTWSPTSARPRRPTPPSWSSPT